MQLMVDWSGMVVYWSGVAVYWSGIQLMNADEVEEVEVLIKLIVLIS